MYLYVPMDGRSVVVKEYIISSTGIQFDEAVEPLEEVVGILLKRLEKGLENTTPTSLDTDTSSPIDTPDVTE